MLKLIVKRVNETNCLVFVDVIHDDLELRISIKILEVVDFSDGCFE